MHLSIETLPAQFAYGLLPHRLSLGFGGAKSQLNSRPQKQSPPPPEAMHLSLGNATWPIRRQETAVNLVCRTLPHTHPGLLRYFRALVQCPRGVLPLVHCWLVMGWGPKGSPGRSKHYIFRTLPPSPSPTLCPSLPDRAAISLGNLPTWLVAVAGQQRRQPRCTSAGRFFFRSEPHGPFLGPLHH